MIEDDGCELDRFLEIHDEAPWDRATLLAGLDDAALLELVELELDEGGAIHVHTVERALDGLELAA